MFIHLQREIDKLKKEIVLLAGKVERSLEEAIQALVTSNLEQARRVRNADHASNRPETRRSLRRGEKYFAPGSTDTIRDAGITRRWIRAVPLRRWR
jgi:phosphate uptake regulator